jgi:hypothetical protein
MQRGKKKTSDEKRGNPKLKNMQVRPMKHFNFKIILRESIFSPSIIPFSKPFSKLFEKVS